MRTLRRIGVLTGGGDCPGLNAVIRAVTKDAIFHGLEVVGIRDGYLGLIEDRTRPLSVADVSGILTAGGTILGSSNKASPQRFPVGKDANGQSVFGDVTDRCIATIKKHNLDAVAVIGGDGSMTIASHLAQSLSALGVPIVGIPKTIDNDLYGTELTFGFLTAVSIATEAIDRVHTTAASHHRIMVVEVMGRNSGWIALFAGTAGGADIILLPEIPFSFDAVQAGIARRQSMGKTYTVIVCAEGARPKGGQKIVARIDPSSPDPIRLGGVGKFVADELESRTGIESRYVVLGHTQRGGTPVPPDRILGTEFGHHAMQLLRQGKFNRMVALKGTGLGDPNDLSDVDLSVPAGKQRLVPVDTLPGGDREHRLISAARAVYTSFGDEL